PASAPRSAPKRPDGTAGPGAACRSGRARCSPTSRRSRPVGGPGSEAVHAPERGKRRHHAPFPLEAETAVAGGGGGGKERGATPVLAVRSGSSVCQIPPIMPPPFFTGHPPT